MEPELECRIDASRAGARDLVENQSRLPITEPDRRRGKMEELMRVLSELPAEDVAVAVALATLRHKAAGSSPEPSLRSLRSDGALYDRPPPSRHIRRMQTASDGSGRRPTKGRHSRRDATASHSPPFATAPPPPKSSFRDAGLRASERCSERPGASIGPARRMLPRFVELEAGSLYSIPPEPGKRRAPDSSCVALCTGASASVSSCMTSRTEALVRALSPKEKDRLLRHFLSSPRKPSGRGRRGGARAGVSNNKDSHLEESEVLDVQAGLWRSLRDKKETAVCEDLDNEAVRLGLRASRREHRMLRRTACEERALEQECMRLVVAASKREFQEMYRRNEEEEIECNDEAVQLGLRASRREHRMLRNKPCEEEALEEECMRLVVAASKREFQKTCRKNEKEEIECNALIEKAKLASLPSSRSCPPFFLRRESGNYASSPEYGTRASH